MEPRRTGRLWTPGDPPVGPPGPFLPDCVLGGHDAHPVDGAPPAYFFAPVGPTTPAVKTVFIPTGDDSPLQFDPYTGSLVSDPGTARWDALHLSDDAAHYVAAHSPSGTKRNVSTIEAVNFVGPAEHWLDYRACYIGAAPITGTTLSVIVTTADGEELTAGPVTLKTGAYALSASWQDFSLQLNDNGFVGAPAAAKLELRIGIPGGYAGYVAITYAVVRIVP